MYLYIKASKQGMNEIAQEHYPTTEKRLKRQENYPTFVTYINEKCVYNQYNAKCSETNVG